MKRLLLLSILCSFFTFGKCAAFEVGPDETPGMALARSIREEQEAREYQKKVEKAENKDDIMFGAIVFVVVAVGFFLVSKGLSDKKDIHIHND